MNCGAWEERVALYAGDDLAPEDALQIEQQVAECAGRGPQTPTDFVERYFRRRV